MFLVTPLWVPQQVCIPRPCRHSSLPCGSPLISETMQHFYPQPFPPLSLNPPPVPPPHQLPCSLLLHRAQHAALSATHLPTWEGTNRKFCFCTRCPLRPWLNPPPFPQNRNNNQSHAKSRYILSWHTGEQLARGWRGTGEAGERRQSYLQEWTEVSTDPPAGAQTSLNSAWQRSGGDPKTQRACRNSSVGESRGRAFGGKAQKESMVLSKRPAGWRGRPPGERRRSGGHPAPPLKENRPSRCTMPVGLSIQGSHPPATRRALQTLLMLEFPHRHRRDEGKCVWAWGLLPCKTTLCRRPLCFLS